MEDEKSLQGDSCNVEPSTNQLNNVRNGWQQIGDDCCSPITQMTKRKDVTQKCNGDHHNKNGNASNPGIRNIVEIIVVDSSTNVHKD